METKDRFKRLETYVKGINEVEDTAVIGQKDLYLLDAWMNFGDIISERQLGRTLTIEEIDSFLKENRDALDCYSTIRSLEESQKDFIHFLDANPDNKELYERVKLSALRGDNKQYGKVNSKERAAIHNCFYQSYWWDTSWKKNIPEDEVYGYAEPYQGSNEYRFEEFAGYRENLEALEDSEIAKKALKLLKKMEEKTPRISKKH